jgi:hypothetical protein
MPGPRERFGRRCDALVFGGIALLLVFSPLAFGSVHPWARAVLQLIVASLVAVWACKVLAFGSTPGAAARLRRWVPGLLVFTAAGFVQVLPLPPQLLRALSPHTHELYHGALYGWPSPAGIAELRDAVRELQRSTARPPQLGPLPSVDEPAIPDGTALIERLGKMAERFSAASSWRTLSVYPYRTGEALLLALTYMAVFFCSSPIPSIQSPTVGWRNPTAASLRGCVLG